MSQGTHLRKYGVQTTIDFEVYEVDGVDLRTDWTPAQADCEIMKDEGASTMCDNTATDEGSTYSIVLTATEMEAARLVLKIVDAAAKVFLDKIVIIETYGNASAQHAVDLNDSVRAGLTALPNAVPDAAGGLPTSDGTVALTAGINGHPEVDIKGISGATLPADNLESQYDTNGLTGDTFPATQAQIGTLSTGSATVSTIAASTEATTPAVVGTPTNTFTSTVELDGIYHSWVPAGGELEFAYNFNIGANASPTTILWHGFAQANNDVVSVYARNWTGPSWQQIGTIDATASATDQEQTFNLTTAHVNTGANAGDVRIRFVSTGGTIITAFATDQILCGFTITNQSTGYANGAVWFNSAAGNTNTTDFVDGVADNPVSSWSAVKTLIGSTGLKRVEVTPGSTLTLDANADALSIMGESWTLALASQSVSAAFLHGAEVSGICTGANPPHFHDCHLGNTSIPPAHITRCGFEGTLTITGAGNYFIDRSHAAIAQPVLDFEDAAENKNVFVTGYAGDLEIANIGQAGSTDELHIDGNGKLVLASTCEAATIEIQGNIELEDNVAGGFVSGAGGTINQDARVDNPSVADAVWDEALTGSLHNDATSAGRRLRQLASLVIANDTAEVGNSPAINQIQLASGESAVDGTFDPSVIGIIGGMGLGQCRMILEYEGSTKLATLNRDWKVAPDGTSEYIILCSEGGLHVNEGLAQGGGAATITLNSLASAQDDVYIGQFVFLVSGPGQDQVARVTAYNGTSKVATIETTMDGWAVEPTSATGYIMMPVLDIVPTLIGTPADTDIATDIANVQTDTTAILVDTGTTLPAEHAALPTAIENADALLNRDVSNVESGEEDTYKLYSIILAILNSNRASGVWTINQTTGSLHQLKDLTEDANANPVTGVSG